MPLSYATIPFSWISPVKEKGVIYSDPMDAIYYMIMLFYHCNYVTFHSPLMCMYISLLYSVPQHRQDDDT